MDMIKINLSYGGKFISQKAIPRHYKGGYKTSLLTDPDTLDVGLLTENLADMFKYHRDSKLYYKKNGESFVGGMKQVQDDSDVRAVINFCTSRDSNSFELYVDHELPNDHQDTQMNKMMVKQLKRLENGLVLKDNPRGMPGAGPARRPHSVDVSAADEYVKDRNNRIEANARKMSALGIGKKAKAAVPKPATVVQPSTSVPAPVHAPATADVESVVQVGSNIVPTKAAVRRSLRNIMETTGEESDNDEEVEEMEDESIHIDSVMSKHSRGPSRGLELAKKRRRNEHIEVVIPPDRLRICGQNSNDMISEIGIIGRQFAPVDVAGWRQIKLEDKEHLWLMIKNKFSLSDDDTNARGVVLKQFANQYRNWRHRLHKDYYKPCASKEEAILNKPPDVELPRWKELCKQFDCKKFKARCETNTLNRSKQKISKHGSGSMGFARREFELTDKQTSTRPSMLELWKVTHWSIKKNDWTCEESKAVHEKATVIIDTLRSEGKAVDEDKVFEDILGKKGSYVRGRGRGLKPIERAKLTIQSKDKEMAAMKEDHEKEIAALTNEAREAREAVEEVKAYMVNQKTETDSKINALIEKVTTLTKRSTKRGKNDVSMVKQGASFWIGLRKIILCRFFWIYATLKIVM